MQSVLVKVTHHEANQEDIHMGKELVGRKVCVCAQVHVCASTCVGKYMCGQVHVWESKCVCMCVEAQMIAPDVLPQVLSTLFP